MNEIRANIGKFHSFYKEAPGYAPVADPRLRTVRAAPAARLGAG